MGNMLIIGGAGFIGATLARRAIGRGERPHIVVGPDTDLWRLQDVIEQIDVHRFDFRDQAAAAACIRQSEPGQVYFLATRTRAVMGSPIAETKRLIDEDLSILFTFVGAAAEAPRPPKYFVRAGSLAEYGEAPSPYHETARDRPLTLYGAALSAGTALLNALRSDLPFAAISLRLALTYGPMQATSFLIPSLIERLGRGEPVHIENPESARDLIYIDDVVDGFEAFAMPTKDHPDCVNISTGVAPNMRQVAQIVIEAMGADPKLVSYGENRAQSGAFQFAASPALANSLTGWGPKTDLESGIRRTVSFWKARNS